MPRLSTSAAGKENHLVINEERVNKVISSLQNRSKKKQSNQRDLSTGNSKRKRSTSKKGLSQSRTTKESNKAVDESRLTMNSFKIDQNIQRILDRERTYLEDQLMKEKKESTFKDSIITNLKQDIEALATQLQQVAMLQQQELLERQEKKKKKKKG